MSDPVLALVRDRMSAIRIELGRLEQVETMLSGSNGHAVAAPVKTRRVVKRKPAERQLSQDTAALEADVLSALKKLRRPVKAGEVCDHVPGSDKPQIVAALRALAKKRSVVKSGATISLRYALPEFATSDAEGN